MDLINVNKYLKGECKEDGTRLFSLVEPLVAASHSGPSDKTRVNRHKLKQEVPSKHQKTLFYCEDDRAVAQVAQRACESPSLEIFKSHLDIVLGYQL